ncbi:MAG TPA: hypothetical protein VFJ09_04240 [Nocardioidaceae bacterium]|nr:hypothetical protein [Nocardioidaceae bacterium]
MFGIDAEVPRLRGLLLEEQERFRSLLDLVELLLTDRRGPGRSPGRKVVS